MDININGLSPGVPQHDAKVELEKKAEQAAIAAKKETEQKKASAVKEEKKEEEKEPEREPVDMTKFVMSSTDMKELLLLMGSRGKSEAIERMVEVVKKEREMLKNQ
ncbi:MAG: hypothetical protein A2Y33_04470 [Spirochaetes bacterium GWF1_51_8]|nr:MAG: hypothetical protein A2Y33_04470 [Spirochaetes bacterium GWF1_51_8]